MAWATQREADILAGVGVSKRASNYTLKDALEKYKAEVTPGKAGRRWEEIRLDKFINDLEFVGERIADIEADQIAAWRDARLKVIKPPSVRREMTLLSSVFEHAKSPWKWRSTNPVREVKRPSNGRPRDRRISPDEERRLLEELGYVEGAAPETKMQELAYVFLIALETAMRQGEILGLVRERVHLKVRYVDLDKTKNGDARKVPLSTRATALVKVLADGAGERQKLFTLASGSADALFRKVRDRLKIDGLHFHDTRHEATTRLARKLDVLDLARMTGHRDPRSLMVYYNATATEVASRLD
ncbi:site-specific integrase [Pseudomonas citronellolis]|uniref:site-specific integrase n=1 Tax=Pseudomonas citronellolis TaxID=53408 RepID=UPI0021BF2921|nr:site-specific integrase [Pseudomonas citronellolis]UXJ53985.1 site-specific integrase [Pseudomonas citronellolis]